MLKALGESLKALHARIRGGTPGLRSWEVEIIRRSDEVVGVGGRDILMAQAALVDFCQRTHADRINIVVVRGEGAPRLANADVELILQGRLTVPRGGGASVPFQVYAKTGGLLATFEFRKSPLHLEGQVFAVVFDPKPWEGRPDTATLIDRLEHGRDSADGL